MVRRSGLCQLQERHSGNANKGGRIASYKATRLVHEDKYEGMRRTVKHDFIKRGCLISEADGDARERYATVYHAIFGISTVGGATKLAPTRKLCKGNVGKLSWLRAKI